MKFTVFVLSLIVIIACDNHRSKKKHYSKTEIAVEKNDVIEVKKTEIDSPLVGSKTNPIEEPIEWDSIPKNEQNEVAIFFTKFQKRVRLNQKDSLLTLFEFPLYGEWGYAIGRTEEGRDLTKEDFKNAHDKIFNKKVKMQIRNLKVDSFYFTTNTIEKSVNEFQFGVSLNDENDEFESSRHFWFRKTKNGYKLFLISHTG